MDSSTTYVLHYETGRDKGDSEGYADSPSFPHSVNVTYTYTFFTKAYTTKPPSTQATQPNHLIPYLARLHQQRRKSPPNPLHEYVGCGRTDSTVKALLTSTVSMPSLRFLAPC